MVGLYGLTLVLLVAASGLHWAGTDQEKMYPMQIVTVTAGCLAFGLFFTGLKLTEDLLLSIFKRPVVEEGSDPSKMLIQKRKKYGLIWTTVLWFCSVVGPAIFYYFVGGSVGFGLSVIPKWAAFIGFNKLVPT